MITLLPCKLKEGGERGEKGDEKGRLHSIPRTFTSRTKEKTGPVTH